VSMDDETRPAVYLEGLRCEPDAAFAPSKATRKLIECGSSPHGMWGTSHAQIADSNRVYAAARKCRRTHSMSRRENTSKLKQPRYVGLALAGRYDA